MENQIPTFDQRLIGQTEKTMNAILERLLDGTGISEPEWVALVLADAGDQSAQHGGLAHRVASGLKVDDRTAARHIEALVNQGLLARASAEDSRVSLTDDGRRLIHDIRAQTAAVTQRLWGDLPDTDLNIAAQVLSTVLVRAEAELGR